MEFKGWAYVEIGPRGELKRHGHVIDQVSDGHYLIQVYANEFTAAEVVKAEDMLTWKLFPDQTEMQRYINANVKARQQSADETPEGGAMPTQPQAVVRVDDESGEQDKDDLLDDDDTKENGDGDGES